MRLNDPKVPTSALVTSLYGGLERRIEHQVDLLVFNPPYVPTLEDEATVAQDGRDIAGAWAGGTDGMAITDQLLKNVDVRAHPLDSLPAPTNNSVEDAFPEWGFLPGRREAERSGRDLCTDEGYLRS